MTKPSTQKNIYRRDPVDAVRVYSAEPALRRPGQLLRHMRRDIVLASSLAWQLAARDVKAQYRQNYLGYVWAFLPPLLVAASFILLKEAQIFTLRETKVPYAAFVIVGMLLWQIFADALSAPLRTVAGSRDILVRVYFPREALILGGMLVTAFGAAVRLLVLLPVAVYFTGVAPSLLLAPLGIVVLILAGTCCGLLLVPLGVLYRDVEKALPLALMLWMLLTPVVYPLPPQPAEWQWLNIATPVLEQTRDWLLGSPGRDLSCFIAVSAATLAGLAVGWLLMRLATPHLVARLGL